MVSSEPSDSHLAGCRVRLPRLWAHALRLVHGRGAHLPNHIHIPQHPSIKLPLVVGPVLRQSRGLAHHFIEYHQGPGHDARIRSSVLQYRARTDGSFFPVVFFILFAIPPPQSVLLGNFSRRSLSLLSARARWQGSDSFRSKKREQEKNQDDEIFSSPPLWRTLSRWLIGSRALAWKSSSARARACARLD